MRPKTAHEPDAEVMGAAEAFEDARGLGRLLRRNLASDVPTVPLEVPLSVLLAALDKLSRDDLMLLQQRVGERLAS